MKAKNTKTTTRGFDYRSGIACENRWHEHRLGFAFGDGRRRDLNDIYPSIKPIRANGSIAPRTPQLFAPRAFEQVGSG
jgi:hypothetical protein